MPTNAEIVDRILEHWQKLEALPPELLDDEVEFVNAGDAIDPGTRHGRADFLEAGTNFGRAYSSLDLDVECRVEAGDTIGLILVMHLQGRGSGIHFDERMGWLFTLRDEKLMRFEWSREPEALLAQLGG